MHQANQLLLLHLFTILQYLILYQNYTQIKLSNGILTVNMTLECHCLDGLSDLYHRHRQFIQEYYYNSYYDLLPRWGHQFLVLNK